MSAVFPSAPTILDNLIIQENCLISGVCTMMSPTGVAQLTTLQRLAATSTTPDGGLVFDTDLQKLFVIESSVWVAIHTSSTGGFVNSVTGTVYQIDSTGGSDPIISISDNPIIPGIEGVTVPSGTTWDRPAAPNTGEFRFNTTVGKAEIFTGITWDTFTGGTGTGSVTQVDTSGGIQGGPITTVGEISLEDSLVVVGTYFNPAITVNQKGIVINLVEQASPVLTVTGNAFNIDVTGTAQDPIINLTALGDTLPYNFGNGFVQGDGFGRIAAIQSATNLITSVSGTNGNITVSIGNDPVVDLQSGIIPAQAWLYPTAVQTDTYGRVVSIMEGTAPTGGTVTSITAGDNLLGGTITTSGTIDLDPDLTEISSITNTIDFNISSDTKISLISGVEQAYIDSSGLNVIDAIHIGDMYLNEYVIAVGSDASEDIKVYSGNSTTSGLALHALSGGRAILKLFDNQDSFNPWYVGFQSPTLSSNLLFMLPSADGLMGQFIKTDGSEGLYFGDAVVSVSGTASQISTSGTTAITVSLADNPVLPGHESVTLPIGTSAQRPVSPANGMARYNTDTSFAELYVAGAWKNIDTDGGTVTSITAGANLTGGTITTSGTIALDTTITGLTALTSATLTGTTTVGGNISISGNTISSTTGDINITPNGSGAFSLTSATQAVPLRLYESGGGMYVGLVAGTLATNTTFTWPIDAGSANQFLQTNGTVGTPTLTFASAVTSAGISTTSAGVLLGGTNPVTTTGTITVNLDPDLNALALLSGTGYISRTAANTYALRSIVVGSTNLTISGGAGVSGNTSLDLATTITGLTALTSTTLTGTTTVGGNISIAANTISSTNANGDVIVTPNGTGGLSLKGAASIPLKFWNSAATQFVGFTAPSLSTNTIFTLPATAGSANQFLQTNGTAGTPTLTFANAVVSVTGSARIVDSGTSIAPILDLQTGIVTAQAWAFPTNIVTDTYGRVTSVTAGTAPVTSVSGTANQIGSTGGTTPIISIVSNPIISGTGSITIPAGTSIQRPVSPTSAMFRYNSTDLVTEFYNGTTWIQGGSGSVTSVAAGSNLTATPGPITTTGTIALNTTITGLTALTSTTLTGTTTVGGNISISGNVISSTNLNGDVDITPNGTGAFSLTSTTQAVPLRLYESGGGNYSGFKAGTLSVDTTWTLPTSNPAAGGFFYSNGSSVMSIVQANQASTIIVSKSGNNATASRGGLPYLTIAGALAASGITSGDTVIIYPGTYAETGLNIPNGVAVVGVSEADCIISGSSGYCFSMGVSSSDSAWLSNVTINLSSSTASTSLIGVTHIASGTITSFISDVTINLTQTNATAGTDLIDGILFFSTVPATGTINVDNCRINISVPNATTGSVNGVRINSVGTATIKDTFITVTTGAGATGNGTKTSSTGTMKLYNCSISATTSQKSVFAGSSINFYNVLDNSNIADFDSGIYAGNVSITGDTISTTDTNGDLILLPNGTGGVALKGSVSIPLKFYEAGGPNYVALKAGSLSTDTTWTLPLADSSGFFASNGSGTMSITSAVTSVTAGANLTGGVITGTGTIALSTTVSGLTSLSSTTVTGTTTVGGNISISGNTIISTNGSGNVNVTPNGTGVFALTSATQAVPLRLYASGGANYVALKAGTLSSDITFTWPTGAGVANQFLQTNGTSGTPSLSFASAVTSVQISTGSAGITLGGTNPITTTGNISIDLDSGLNALVALGTGIVAKTAAATYAARTITGSTNIGITNGTGVSGDPTIALNTTVTGLTALTSTTLTGTTTVGGNISIAGNTISSTTGAINLTPNGTNAVALTSATQAVPLRLYESGGGNYIGLVSGTLAADTTFTLPLTAGSANQFLQTNGTVGTPTLTFASAVTSIGISSSSAGITLGGVSNPVTTTGTISVDLNAGLNALVALGTGMVAKTAANTYSARTITGTASNISLTNGDGVSGNPTIDLIDTAVSAGSFTSLNATIDAKGRITSASSGSPSAVSNPEYNKEIINISTGYNSGSYGSGSPGANLTMSAASTSVFDTTTVNANSKGFEGACFDGRYVYMMAGSQAASVSGQVTRYDTYALNGFASASSYAVFDTTTVNSNSKGFSGCVFDGVYVYFVPCKNGVTAPNGLFGQITRYDTRLPFASASSYSVFDSQTVNADSCGFQGGVFDGKYIYFVPNLKSDNATRSGIILRYDTTASTGFTSSSSYAVFDSTTVQANSKGFQGAVFDGQYIYFVPHGAGPGTSGSLGQITRYDTQASTGFTSASSYAVFNLATVSASAVGFEGAVFDKRYIYFVPFSSTGVIARYDTQASTGFTSASSYSTFDATTVNASSKNFFGGVFDGKYIYFVPGLNTLGLVTRYNTELPFTSSASYSVYDTTAVNANSMGFSGGIYDGKYVYLVPYKYSSTFSGQITRLVAYSGSPAISIGVSTTSGGITLGGTNPITTNGIISVDLDADLNALAALSTTGIISRTGAATYSPRTITAGSNIGVTNGDGVSGNPTVALSATVTGLTALTSTTLTGTTTVGGNISIAGNVISSTNANGDIDITPNGTGAFALTSATQAVPLRLYESGGGMYVAFKAGVLAGDTTWTLPLVDATGVFISNGSGVMSISGTPTLTSLTAGTITATTTLVGANISIAGNTISSTTGAINLTPNGTNAVALTSATQAVPLRLYESGGGNYIGLVAGTLATDTTFTLPLTAGSANQFLQTNGTAGTPTLTFASAVTSVGLSTTSGGITLGGTNPVTTTGTISVDLNAGLNALVALGTGMVAKTAANTYSARTITAGSNLGVTNGTGVSGDPTIALNATVTGLTALTSATLTATTTLVGANVSIATNTITSTSGNLVLTPVSGNNIAIVGAGGTRSGITLYETSGVNYTGLIAPNSLSGSVQWTLPTADGVANQFLKTNGSSMLSFGSAQLPAGGTAYVQTNGNDSTASVGGLPYLTIAEALLHVPSGGTVLVFPGTYTETGLTIPALTTLRGVSRAECVIATNSTSTTAVTMGVSSVFSDFSITMSPTSNVTMAVVGVNFPSSANGSSMENVSIEISPTSTLSTATAVGIKFTTTGTAVSYNVNDCFVSMEASGLSNAAAVASGILTSGSLSASINDSYISCITGGGALGYAVNCATTGTVKLYDTYLTSTTSDRTGAGTVKFYNTVDKNSFTHFDTGVSIDSQGSLRLYNSATTQYVGLKAGTLSGDTTWTMPTADTSGTFVSDGAGAMSIFTRVYGSIYLNGNATSSSTTSSLAEVTNLTWTLDSDTVGMTNSTTYRLLNANSVVSPRKLLLTFSATVATTGVAITARDITIEVRKNGSTMSKGASCTATPSLNNNGSFSISCFVSMATNDYLSVFASTSGANAAIIITNANLSVTDIRGT